MLAKFSEELREARQRSDMTLQQVAAKTRIDIKFLTAIEAGNFTFQPELYIRAFIKDYCKAIGINEVKMLARFEQAKAGKLEPDITPAPEKELEMTPEPVVPVIKPSIDAVPDPVTQPKIKIVDPYSSMLNDPQRVAPHTINKKIVLAGLIMVVLLVVALVVYVVFFYGSGDKIVAEKPYDVILEENKKKYNEDEQKKPETNLTAISVDSLNLIIKARDTAWVKISIDSTTTEEFMLYPYSKKLLKAKNSFRLTVGNSAGVEFTLNDKPLAFSGRKGRRSELIIDASGVKNLDEIKNQKISN